MWVIGGYDLGMNVKKEGLKHVVSLIMLQYYYSLILNIASIMIF